MNSRHAIRLRGPWQYEVLEQVAGGGTIENIEQSGRIKIPCQWDQPPWNEFYGRVRFLRNFNWPEPLQPHERLGLVFDVSANCSAALLNGENLVRFKGERQVRIDVTTRVELSNKLVIEAERTEGLSPEFIREVYLEVSSET